MVVWYINGEILTEKPASCLDLLNYEEAINSLTFEGDREVASVAVTIAEGQQT